MTELQTYLAEEVAEDLADGIITRREAMRRLGLLGLTTSAASALLTTFAAPVAPARARSRGGEGTETLWSPVAPQSITFAGPRGSVREPARPVRRTSSAVRTPPRWSAPAGPTAASPPCG